MMRCVVSSGRPNAGRGRINWLAMEMAEPFRWLNVQPDWSIDSKFENRFTIRNMLLHMSRNLIEINLWNSMHFAISINVEWRAIFAPPYHIDYTEAAMIH